MGKGIGVCYEGSRTERVRLVDVHGGGAVQGLHVYDDDEASEACGEGAGDTERVSVEQAVDWTRRRGLQSTHQEDCGYG